MAGAAPCPHNHDPAIGEAFLLVDLIVVPASGVKLWQHVFATGVGFSDHLNGNMLKAKC
jgi:hypothetical protein